jgi:hypothetical protein
MHLPYKGNRFAYNARKIKGGNLAYNARKIKGGNLAYNARKIKGGIKREPWFPLKLNYFFVFLQNA